MAGRGAGGRALGAPSRSLGLFRLLLALIAGVLVVRAVVGEPDTTDGPAM